MVHKIKIVVDKRESKVIPFFEPYKKYITVEFETIKTGDYCIIYDDIIVAIIERKRWEDLAASMRDGRKHNTQKLLELRKETNCAVFYLIEGKAFPSMNKKFGNIPVKNLNAHLDHLMFRDNIYMLYTANETHTAERIVSLAQNYWSLENTKTLAIDFNISPEQKIESNLKINENLKQMCSDLFDDQNMDDHETIIETKNIINYKTNFMNGDNTLISELTDDQANEILLNEQTDGQANEILLNEQTDGQANEILLNEKNNEHKNPIAKVGAMELLKKNREIKNMTAHEQILRAIPGIGSVISSFLYENKITLQKIHNNEVTEDQMAKMSFPNGVIVGLATAKRIIKKCKNICGSGDTCHKSRIKILAEIPLISVKTAEKILLNFHFSDIISKKITVQQLSDVQKTEKTKLGNKAAENIITYLGL